MHDIGEHASTTKLQLRTNLETLARTDALDEVLELAALLERRCRQNIQYGNLQVLSDEDTHSRS